MCQCVNVAPQCCEERWRARLHLLNLPACCRTSSFLDACVQSWLQVTVPAPRYTMSFVVHKVQVTDKVLAVINVPTGATQEKTVLLLTHGAGSKKGTVEKNLLPVLAAKVSALGVPVVRVEAFGRVETRFKALQQVDQRLSTGSLHASLPAMPHVVPGGTSMGSRAAAMHARRSLRASAASF